MNSFPVITVLFLHFLQCVFPQKSPVVETNIVDENINSNSRKSEIFLEILDKSNYDVKLRPPGLRPGGKGPTIIGLSLDIRTIENIDDINMQYSVQVSFNQEWLDPRLKYSHLLQGSKISYLQLLLSERIWTPNLYFRNEKKGFLHELVTPNVYTRIFPNGTVFQSYRISLVLSCPMDLTAFPFDVQTCPLEMMSYGMTTKDIVLQWKQPDDAAVIVPKDLILPKFKLEQRIIKKDCFVNTSTGNYSCVAVNFVFDRQHGFYLVQIYIPSVMLTVISWIGFSLEPTEVVARVSLGITTSLASLILTFMLNQVSPPTSYVTAIDVWLFTCQGMVFAVLIEFALINHLTPRKSMYKRISNVVFPTGLAGNHKTTKDKLTKQNEANNDLTSAMQKARTADRMARFCFPFVFLVFCICYFVIYIHILHP